MDSSTYDPSQSSPMIQFTDPQANANNQPVTYGPVLWDVMKSVGQAIQGAQYLVGLSLLDPNSTNVPLIAGTAKAVLGDALDAFLLGNEPDLYTAHQEKPSFVNYTLDNYITDFATTSDHLSNISAPGRPILAGPTICCFWDLATILEGGYLSNFSNSLKYITIQHYPQNNCFRSYDYSVPYYQQHANTVALAAWQQPGIEDAVPNHPILMSEFNSASCGGIPGVSDTFAVGSMWTADYVLQMAAIGYSGAFMHTRERGISYNLFEPTGSDGSWTTNPPYYAYLAVGEALQSPNGSIVVDLNIANSTVDEDATVAGYAIYDAHDHSVQRVVLFNYANHTSTKFALPGNIFPSGAKNNVTVKYLTAVSAMEKWNIAWDGQTLAGVGDGILVSSPSGSDAWSVPTQSLNCLNQCQVDVPAPGIAVVFVGGNSVQSDVQPGNTQPESVGQGVGQRTNSAVGISRKGRIFTVFIAMCPPWIIFLIFW